MRQEYAELQVTSNFSFLRGASHPHELVWRAAELKYRAIAITDHNTLAGIVRAHVAARDAGIQCVIGCRLNLLGGALPHRDSRTSRTLPAVVPLLVYPTGIAGYKRLCALLSHGKRDVSKGEFSLTLSDFLSHQEEFLTIILPPSSEPDYQYPATTATYTASRSDTHLSHNAQLLLFYETCSVLRENARDMSRLSLALSVQYGAHNAKRTAATLQMARSLAIPTVATNDVYYHTPERKPLQDLLTCIRERCTIHHAGFRLFHNNERYLKHPSELARLFRDTPEALSRTLAIAEMASGFSLSQLQYNYPEEICPVSSTPAQHLRDEVYRGARQRYPDGIPSTVTRLIEDELALIQELEYEKYFLTCHDIVAFARSRDILCQGRGAAANSVVCFCLGITAVDPQKIDLLFARFISKERREPPDIDIDFEHERREEVIQYIYEKYGRHRAALTAEVITYRARSAVRDVGKALGLSLAVIDTLAKSVHRWTECAITADTLREIGLNPFDATIQNTLALASEIVGFPRHLGQHVGGFIISQEPLNEIVPIVNAGMPDRTIIEWDKNDIEELGMLKIDILALGMLTCIRKALHLVNRRRPTPLHLHTIPADDPQVYDMLCASDTVGVFQVESRAQMSMLPRLKPRCFYDLVIEVAIVRPGPIQGNMVHPYLRRRAGLERPSYPDERVERILGKTLGVPIFQEQAMRLAITLANFSPGEAEQLRRAMAAWKSHKGVIASFKEKITRGMVANGYTPEFADTCLNQIKGFSEYGFPESHAASFAHLVYASAWLKRHHPAEFACALLNSQPMGFYAPAQIVRDAQRHGIAVRAVDINASAWDCAIMPAPSLHERPSVQLGLRLIAGLRREHAAELLAERETDGGYTSVAEVWNRTSRVSKATLHSLAHADAYTSLNLERRTAHWELHELPPQRAPLDPLFAPSPTRDRHSPTATRTQDSKPPLPSSTLQREMFADYETTGLSLRAHPIQFIRAHLTQRGAVPIERLSIRHGKQPGALVSAGGLIITRQRPGTAKGVVFLTLEDETGTLNVIIRPALFDRHRRTVLQSESLIATGRLQRIGEVIYIEAARIESCSLASPSSLTAVRAQP